MYVKGSGRPTKIFRFSLLASKFENLTRTPESAFSKQRKRLLDQPLRRSSAFSQRLPLCPPWLAKPLELLSPHYYIFKATKLAQVVGSTKGQYTAICGMQTQRRWNRWQTGRDVLARSCNAWLPQCPAPAKTRCCVFTDKGFQRLMIVTKFQPLSEQMDDLRLRQPCRNLSVKSGIGEGDAIGCR